MAASLKQTDLAALGRSVKHAQWTVIGIGVAAFLAYFVWFGIAFGRWPSDDTGSWGEFGDYIGGLLNPLVAFAAFYWLTRSVLLQKEELAETRKALSDSSDAQATQARYTFEAARLSALTALSSVVGDDVERLRSERHFLSDQAAKNLTGSGGRELDGTWIDRQSMDSRLRELTRRIDERIDERAKIEEELRKWLRSNA